MRNRCSDLNDDLVYKLHILYNLLTPHELEFGRVEMASSSEPTGGTEGLLLEEFPVFSGAAKNFVADILARRTSRRRCVGGDCGSGGS